MKEGEAFLNIILLFFMGEGFEGRGAEPPPFS